MKNEVKAILFIIILIFSGFNTQQDAIPEQIDWDTHFRGEPDENSAFAALTVTTWQYSYNSTIRNNNRLNIDFKFLAGVDPERSWVKRNRIRDRRTSRELLNHEQGHVYINFLLLKNGEIQIKNQKYTVNNYKKLIQQTANRISDYYSKLQERYDIETKHGSDLTAQNKWDEFIRSEMNKFN